jgi:hypothetical protein
MRASSAWSSRRARRRSTRARRHDHSTRARGLTGPTSTGAPVTEDADPLINPLELLELSGDVIELVRVQGSPGADRARSAPARPAFVPTVRGVAAITVTNSRWTRRAARSDRPCRRRREGGPATKATPSRASSVHVAAASSATAITTWPSGGAASVDISVARVLRARAGRRMPVCRLLAAGATCMRAPRPSPRTRTRAGPGARACRGTTSLGATSPATPSSRASLSQCATDESQGSGARFSGLRSGARRLGSLATGWVRLAGRGIAALLGSLRCRTRATPGHGWSGRLGCWWARVTDVAKRRRSEL